MLKLHLLTCLLLVSVLGAGCVAATPKAPLLTEDSGYPASARYAILFGNIFGGYRDADGSAEGLLWLVDDEGRVVAESERFAPISMAAMRSDDESIFFTGDAAGYELTSAGLAVHPRAPHDTGNVVVTHISPEHGPIVSINIGVGQSGEYLTDILNISDPNRDHTVTRYVEAISSCGKDTFLLTTDGLSPTGPRWEDLNSREVLATSPTHSADGINGGDLPCDESTILALEQTRDMEGRVEQVQILSWDTIDGFSETRTALVDANGDLIGTDGTWDDGSRNALHYWFMDGQLVWSNPKSEIWTADPVTGLASRTHAPEPTPNQTGHADTPQGNSLIRTRVDQDTVTIVRLSVPSGKVEDEVVVQDRPAPKDMLPSDTLRMPSSN